MIFDIYVTHERINNFDGMFWRNLSHFIEEYFQLAFAFS